MRKESSDPERHLVETVPRGVVQTESRGPLRRVGRGRRIKESPRGTYTSHGESDSRGMEETNVAEGALQPVHAHSGEPPMKMPRKDDDAPITPLGTSSHSELYHKPEEDIFLYTCTIPFHIFVGTTHFDEDIVSP